MILNERQALILESLNIYGYLTVKQLVKIGVYHTEQGIRDKIIYKLKSKPHPLVKVAEFGFMPKKGRLAGVHFLTPKGAKVLAEYLDIDPEKIHYPKGQVQFTRDYFHRIEFIDLHIVIRQWVKVKGYDLDFFHSYYKSQGNQRQKNSQLVRDTQVRLEGNTIIPDGNFRLKMENGTSRLFTLELHRGTHTQRIFEQLEAHANIIEQDLLAQKYDHPNANYVLSVYENSGIMESAKKKLMSSPEFADNFKDHYAFNTVENLKKDFSKSWKYADNQDFTLFL